MVFIVRFTVWNSREKMGETLRVSKLILNLRLEIG